MDSAYTKAGLTQAMQAAATAAGITLVKLEIEDSEFPFLVGVVCGNQQEMKELKEEIRKMSAYDYTGGVGGETTMVMNLVPRRALPADAQQRIYHRMMLREAILSDTINGGR